MKRSLSLVVLLWAAGWASGQSTVVAPTALNGVEGSFTYIYAIPITFQQVFAPSQLIGLTPGDVISGMQLRLDNAFLSSPLSTVSNFDVSIGPSNFAPGSLTASVAGNQGAGTVLARSGSLSFPLNSFSTGGSPNAFGPVIPFTNTFTYTGGNLLITVSHTAPSSELQFDIGSGIAGAQIAQTQSFNATTLTDFSSDTGLAMQFTIAVPEPATYYAAAMSLTLCGVIVHRRFRKKRIATRK